MKRWSPLALVIAGSIVLYFLQRSNANTEFSPRPLLYLLADTQREAERIPLALTQVSDQDEIKIGEQIAREYGLTSVPSEDPDAARISEYLNSVGVAVAKHVQRKAIAYHFYLQDNRYFVNAFALPGGNIVVGRGLLELMKSEDELAFVLGHEIAHVDDRDAIGRLQYELASRKIGLGGFYQLGRPAVEIFKAGYTKEQELDADRVGLGLAVAANYSPTGAINLMKRFQKLKSVNTERANSPVEELAELPVDVLQEYFRSHPSAAERRAALETEIVARGYDISKAERPLAIRAIFLSDAGERLNRAGEFQKSIEQYTKALDVDPNYVRAWRGLAEAAWRSGDAEETARAETDVVHRTEATARDWELLARSLADSEEQSGATQLEALVLKAYPKPDDNNDAYVAAKIGVGGLKLMAGRKDAFAKFAAFLPAAARSRGAALRAMAWWTYRARAPRLAARELESARQVFPQSPKTTLQLVWVLSDLGRQADAEQMLANDLAPVDSRNTELADQRAAQAVVDWRTENRDAAHREFRDAAQLDPVWLGLRWVVNNYSSSAIQIIKQLQAAEAVRRMKEIQKRKRLALQHR